jgi:NADH-quinone oxidoreductase subunit M
MAILAVSTVILAAAYLLWMYQRVMHGPVVNEKIHGFPDLNTREIAYLVPIVVMMFWMGIFPQTFLRKMDGSVALLVNRIQNRERVFVREGRRPGQISPTTVKAGGISDPSRVETGTKERSADE